MTYSLVALNTWHVVLAGRCDKYFTIYFKTLHTDNLTVVENLGA